MPAISDQIQFENWVANPTRNTLKKSGVETRLEKRLMTIIIALAKAPEQQLSKEELLAIAWKNKVVSDETLSVAISHLRKALGCNAKNPIYIETISGYGFRLIPPARFISDNKQKKPPNKAWSWTVTTLVMLVAAVLLWQTLSKKEQIDPSTNPAFSKARYLLQKDDKSISEAIAILENLLQKYPDNAIIVSEYARSLFLHDISQYGMKPGPNANDISNLLHHALALEPELASAHSQLGKVHYYYKHELKLAEKHFQQSLSSAPENTDTIEHYRRLLLSMREYNKAIHYAHTLRKINPKKFTCAGAPYTYLLAGQLKSAAEEITLYQSLSTEVQPCSRTALFLAELKNEQQAFKIMLEYFRLAKYSAQEIAAATAAYNNGGLKQLNLWLAETKQETRDVGHFTPPISTARYYMNAGQYTKALDYLEKAAEQRSHSVMWINSDPKFKPLHLHERFKAITKKLGLSAAKIKE